MTTATYGNACVCNGFSELLLRIGRGQMKIRPEQRSQPFPPLVLLLFYLRKPIYRYIAVMLIFMKIIGPRNVLA